MTSPVLALFPDTAEIKGDRLFIGGCDTVALAREFGTPFYLFDALTLRRRCQLFREEFGRLHPDSLIIYACKAFINRGLVRLLRGEGLGLDVVSGGEIAIASAAGFPMERVYFHGNNKSREELELALRVGVGRVVVDNFHELSLLEEVAVGRGQIQPILLRLSPGVDPHTHAHTTTGVVDSKFGFLMDRGEQAVAQALKSPHLGLLGLHFHLGSPIFEVEPYIEAMRRVLAFAAEIKKKFGWQPQEFSPGGGFAVSYVLDRPAPPLAFYAQAIVGALKQGVGELGLSFPQLVLEPGRAVVAQAGVALYRMGAQKEIPGLRHYVSVDGGMGDNIRPALYGSLYQALVANKASQPPAGKVTIAGKFCESGDVLIRDIPLPPLAAGDLLAVPVSGAYSIPMSSNYNANPRPPILLVEVGRATLWRRRESYSDLMALDTG